MPGKNFVNMPALTSGGIGGLAASLASNVEALRAFAPAVGFGVSGAMTKDKGIQATAHYLAGFSLAGNLSASSGLGSAPPGGFL